MSLMDLSAARARGIALPTDDQQAQAIIDEVEAEMARVLGQLVGPRTETFYTGWATSGKLALSRYTDEATILDNGTSVDADHFRLVDRGSAIARNYFAPSWWWTGPYVEVTYSPNDETEVRAIGYQALVLSATPETASGSLISEDIGDYGYQRATILQSPQGSIAARKALIRSLLPKRDSLYNIRPTHGDFPSRSDGIINRAEAPL
jgi:hypothetical protein